MSTSPSDIHPFFDNIFDDGASAVPLPESPVLTPIVGGFTSAEDFIDALHTSFGIDDHASSPITPFSTPYGTNSTPGTDYNAFASSPHLQSSGPRRDKKRSRRNRSPDIDIFVDPALPEPPSRLVPKKKKKVAKTGRRTLGEVSGNIQPSPSPRVWPGLSPTGPCFENQENLDPFAPPPPPSRQPPPPPRRQRVPRPRPRPSRVAPVAPAPDLEPVNLVLYGVLELYQNWKANDDEIRAAYRRVALLYHPDKVAVEDKELATECMSQINAAKDVLLDSVRRAEYHRTGKIPW